VNKYVLDASAVLALLNRESGQEKVEAILGDSVISAVNLSEVASKLIDAGLSDEEARETIDLLNVDVISFDVDQAHLGAMLRAKAKKLGLSLGDRSCLALGLSRQQTVVTAEREWAKLRIGVEIEIIR
jgi:PIN domain nuclease of toxin-antitoxin system